MISSGAWRRTTLVAALLAVASPHEARAAREEVSIEYAAPAGCPERAAFVAWVSARSTRGAIVEARPGMRRFVVAVFAQEDRFAGVLRVIDISGESSIRSIESPTCADLALGLALTTALAIDEMADPVPPRAPPAGPPPRRRAEVFAGLHVASSAGVSPGHLVGVNIFADAAVAGTRRARARLGLDFRTSDGARAAFTRVLVQLDVCPLEIPAGPLGVQPCAALEGGALMAWARGVSHAKTHVRPWVSAGALARVSWRFTPRARLEIDGAVLLPLVRDRFFVAGEMVHEVPLATFSLGAGIALSFP